VGSLDSDSWIFATLRVIADRERGETDRLWRMTRPRSSLSIHPADLEAEQYLFGVVDGV
jgi:hypothetical protein